MIESWIRNDQTLRRYRRFKRNRLAVVFFFGLTFFSFLSLTAEMWANNRPLIMVKDSKFYFPVFKDYSAEEFGITDALVIDYRSLSLKDSDFVIWPIIKWNPYESNMVVPSYPSPPTSRNLFGTDDRGRDVLTRLLYGLRYSLTYAFAVWFFTILLGTLFGGLMGLYGGKIDFVGQRIVEIFNAIPKFFLLIILIATFRPNLFYLILISSIFGWVTISYYIRAEFLKNRKMEFVEAAIAMGASTKRIFLKHILPNSLAPIITFSPFFIAGNVTGLASLDFLGLGLMPPTPSWGELLNQAKNYFTIGWWLAFFPSLALFSFLVSLAVIGEAIRDAMDPHG